MPLIRQLNVGDFAETASPMDADCAGAQLQYRGSSALATAAPMATAGAFSPAEAGSSFSPSSAFDPTSMPDESAGAEMMFCSPDIETATHASFEFPSLAKTAFTSPAAAPSTFTTTRSTTTSSSTTTSTTTTTTTTTLYHSNHPHHHCPETEVVLMQTSYSTSSSGSLSSSPNTISPLMDLRPDFLPVIAVIEGTAADVALAVEDTEEGQQDQRQQDQNQQDTHVHLQDTQADAEMAALEAAAAPRCLLRGILIITPIVTMDTDGGGAAHLSSPTSSSASPSCFGRRKRVSFKADDMLAAVHQEEAWGAELAHERREGRIWQLAALDRSRFRRRIDEFEPVFCASLQRKVCMRFTLAARAIQAAFRGYLCRQHGCLSARNRQQSPDEQPKAPSRSAERAREAREEGISYKDWQKNFFQLPSCPAAMAAASLHAPCDGKRRQRKPSVDVDGRGSPRPEHKSHKKRNSRRSRTSSSDEGDM